MTGFYGGGGEDAHYTHDQSTPAAVWVITHDLNKYPSVTVRDSAGTVVHGDIHFDSLSQITLTFAAAFSGRAHLN